jgi:alpha-beta hydrolase superfamily lysophospholipase
MTESFSRSELNVAGPGNPAPVERLAASDGVDLAYRAYRPEAPVAALVFHHGGGAHSGAGYAHLAAGLRDQVNVAVYTPDLRGHGASDGAPGDAPSSAQVWRDVASFVALARSENPGLPVFVGGHSSGAGVALNYSSWSSSDEREPVDGYVLLSPQLGFRSGTDRPRTDDDPPPFAEASVWPFVVHAMTGGSLLGHYQAVRFNYPEEVLAADPGMVRGYTVNFANAVTPSAPHDQFAALDRPFGLWIGADDELFVPEAVVAFADLSDQPNRTAAIIPGATHLGILVDAHETIGPWLSARAESAR